MYTAYKRLSMLYSKTHSQNAVDLNNILNISFAFILLSSVSCLALHIARNTKYNTKQPYITHLRSTPIHISSIASSFSIAANIKNLPSMFTNKTEEVEGYSCIVREGSSILNIRYCIAILHPNLAKENQPHRSTTYQDLSFDT